MFSPTKTLRAARSWNQDCTNIINWPRALTLNISTLYLQPKHWFLHNFNWHKTSHGSGLEEVYRALYPVWFDWPFRPALSRGIHKHNYVSLDTRKPLTLTIQIKKPNKLYLMYGYFPVIRTCDVVWSVSRCNTYPVYEIHGRKVQHSWGDSTDHTNELKGRKFTFVILRKEESSNTHNLSYNAGILLKHWDKALRLFGQLLRFQRKVEFDCSAPMELNNSRQSSLYLF